MLKVNMLDVALEFKYYVSIRVSVGVGVNYLRGIRLCTIKNYLIVNNIQALWVNLTWYQSLG